MFDKMHPMQKATFTAVWRGNRYAHHPAQGTGPGGKNHHSNHLRQPRK